MIEEEFQDFLIRYSQNTLTIVDSYKINNREEMEQFLKKILRLVPLYKTRRSINSLVNE